jgi:hypothetical protein
MSQWNDNNGDNEPMSPRDGFTTNSTSTNSRVSTRASTRRAVLTTQKTKLYQISQHEYDKLCTFLQPVGVELAATFAKEAVDLDIILMWENPEHELKEIGITQRGIIFKLVKLIKDLQKETQPTDVYERDKVTQLGIYKIN